MGLVNISVDRGLVILSFVSVTGWLGVRGGEEALGKRGTGRGWRGNASGFLDGERGRNEQKEYRCERAGRDSGGRPHPGPGAPLTARLRRQAAGRSRGRVRPKQDGGPPSLPPGSAFPEDLAWSRAAGEGRSAPAAEGERSLQQNFRETLICVLFT